MPLPPAPTKRAALLTQAAFDAPARSASKPPRRTEKQEDRHPVARQASPRAIAERETIAKVSTDHANELSNLNVNTTARIVVDKSQSKDAQTTVRGDDSQPSSNVRAAAKPRRTKSTGPTKLFVLDTNVLMHDPMCLFRFEEHDIFLPMIVLEELDGHKKGMTEVARNARQTSRSLDALAGTNGADIGVGLQLDTTGHREAKGPPFGVSYLRYAWYDDLCPPPSDSSPLLHAPFHDRLRPGPPRNRF